MIESPEPEQEEKTFGDLPLDLQRTVIDWCIANREPAMVKDGVRYELPHMLQFTYRCSDPTCNEVVSARFFRNTIIRGGVVATRRCPKCRASQMYVSHKTAVLDYYLGPERKKQLKGLEKFLFKQIQEDKEQYGPPVESYEE